jgi:hypothetical protein
MRFSRRGAADMRLMTAKRNGTCSETGKPIEVGQEIAYDPSTQRAFHEDSQTAQNLRAQQFAQAWNMADANF